jgi:hypothetical protein
MPERCERFRLKVDAVNNKTARQMSGRFAFHSGRRAPQGLTDR